LRREKLYSSQLKQWRRELTEQGSQGVNKTEPGPTPARTPEQRRIDQLEKENARLNNKLQVAEDCIDLQNVWTAAVMQAPTFDGREAGYANVFGLALQAYFASGLDGESRTPGPNNAMTLHQAVFLVGLGACRTAGCRHLARRLRSLGVYHYLK